MGTKMAASLNEVASSAIWPLIDANISDSCQNSTYSIP